MEVENFVDIYARTSANFDLLSLMTGETWGLKIKIKDGNSKKDKIKETRSPYVIIQPKSITGFMSLNIKDIKAQIVVRTA